MRPTLTSAADSTCTGICGRTCSECSDRDDLFTAWAERLASDPSCDTCGVTIPTDPDSLYLADATFPTLVDPDAVHHDDQTITCELCRAHARAAHVDEAAAVERARGVAW